MRAPTAVIFDLGGTLVDWVDWQNGMHSRWSRSYALAALAFPEIPWPDHDSYVVSLEQAEQAYWRRVESSHWSGPATALIQEAVQASGWKHHTNTIQAILNSYERVVSGWAIVCEDARETLQLLRCRGYQLGLLSNTWWPSDWHLADLESHRLADLLDEVVLSSELPYAKPHASAFLEVAARLHKEPDACVMVGDRMIDDIMGALEVGMRAVWKKNSKPWPAANTISPTAEISRLSELPLVLQKFGGQ